MASGEEESTRDEKYKERFTYFLGLLSSKNPGDRWRAIEVLARTRDERAIEPLIAALEDEDWRVRQKAAWALGYLGDPRALTPLRRALGDPREGVDDMIYEALDRIKRRMAEVLREQGP
jgi:HEAT repeat protein